MSQAGPSASVESIEVLRLFKAALVKFAEAANVALGDAESDMRRTQVWLEGEQLTHWATQVRRRTEAVTKAKEAVRYKKLFKNAVGGRDSVVDEEKALARAMHSLQVAEQKLAATKAWARRMQREVQNYKGVTQRLASTVQSDIPVALAKLEKLASILDAYAAAGKLGTPEGFASAMPMGGGEAIAATKPAGAEAEPASGEADGGTPATQDPP